MEGVSDFDLTALRAIAQDHLKEIGALKERERQEDQEVQTVLAEEADRRANKKQFSAGGADSGGEGGRCGKLRSAQDVLDRLRWDPQFSVSEYIVGYLDRFGGNKEIRVSQWLNESTEEDWVPQHRIRYFKKSTLGGDEEIVWHRLRRIDRIFRSSGGTE